MSATPVVPKRPALAGWNPRRLRPEVTVEGYLIEAWVHVSGLAVLSSVECRVGRAWEYHISVSSATGRPSDMEVLRAIVDFDLIFADEINLLPGVARHFWQPVQVEKGAAA